MRGRDTINSAYTHEDIGTFAVTVTGAPASLAADLLATAFAGLEATWKTFFGANYPKVADTAMLTITAGAAASGIVRVASAGVTFATEPIAANTKTTLFVQDLSKIRLQTADAVLRVEW